MSELKNRYEFVYLFDVENGNPNGDPDAGNLPRIDPETNHGIVTDVCLKRKIRNYVEITKGGKRPTSHLRTREGHSDPGAEERISRARSEDCEWMRKTRFRCCAHVDVPELLRHQNFRRCDVPERVPTAARFAVPFNSISDRALSPFCPERSPSLEWLSQRRRKPRARRVTTEPWAGRILFRTVSIATEGYVSGHLAQQTGFSTDDLDLLWDALINMFEHDHSAARGKMAARKLFRVQTRR